MSLNQKIRRILEEKNLSPSIFADEIGVQRSSISHILAERNRPSLEIIQKIVKRFPDLGLEWIMDDESFSLSAAPKSPQPAAAKREEPVPVPNHELPSPGQEVKNGKKIEKIIVFYTDGTFSAYTQS